MFSNDFNGQTWTGSLVAYNNTKPFADTFNILQPGGPSNYTGVSQSLQGESFVWRGFMSGVDCEYHDKCSNMCATEDHYLAWSKRCSYPGYNKDDDESEVVIF